MFKILVLFQLPDALQEAGRSHSLLLGTYQSKTSDEGDI